MRIYNGPAYLTLAVKRGTGLPASAELAKVCAAWLKDAGKPDSDKATLAVEVSSKEEQTLLLQKLTKHFTPITAAGGIVRDGSPGAKSRLLLIYRRGSWDLPKGKIESGEAPPEAALREVMEETGLKKLKLESLLPDTLHVYQQGKKWMLKQTFWFGMRAYSRTLVPQAEEDIEWVEWVPEAEVLKRKPMYATIQGLLRSYLRKSQQ